MSLQIYIAFTGERLLADPISFASPEALRSWITGNVGIPSARQILMTAKGKNVKQAHLLSETEVFVYDRQLLSTGGDDDPPAGASTPSLSTRETPKTITDQNNLQSWRNLFMTRRAWALDIAEVAVTYRDFSVEELAKTEVIHRCAGIALENLKNHTTSLQRKHEESQKWARETLREHHSALDDWRDSLAVLERVPASMNFLFLLKRPSTPTKEILRPSGSDNEGTLHDYVNLPEVEDAGRQLATSAATFSAALSKIDQAMQNLALDTAAIEETRKVVWPISCDEVESLLQEIETLAKKISSDYDDILRLQNDQKSVATASKRALVHTRDMLPAMKATFDELVQAAEIVATKRDEVLHRSVQALRDIASVESSLASIQHQVTSLDVDIDGTEALEVVNGVFQIPVAYGSTLIESIRRTEWVDRLKIEAGTLTDDMKVLQEEEQRRRKKWLKSMGSIVHGALDDCAKGLHVQLPDCADQWPRILRDDIFTYVEDLSSAGIDDAVQQVTHQMKELEQSAKPRKRPSRAFKNGSVYEAGFGLGQSSTLSRNNDDTSRTLQEEKLKLEDKLRASDSRVRKLEDLLHRQSQVARPVSGDFTPQSGFERQVTPPLPYASPRPNEMLSRRSSAASRRLSGNQNPEEKALVQRIVSLEADLTRLQREAHAERRASTESRDKMQEAESTKNDLMANFEAQRQEFDDERQILEDELHKVKIRLEEAEDELDRVLGSRDHQKLTSDQATKNFQAELEQLRTSSANEIRRVNGEAELLREELAVHQDRYAVFDKQYRQLREDKSSLQQQNMQLAGQLRDVESERLDHISTLQAAHANLSEHGSAPEELSRLVKAIEVLSEGLAFHSRASEDAAQRAMAENKSLADQVEQGEAETKLLKRRLEEHESELRSTRESLSQEQSRLASLRTQLEDEEAELRNLRSKFAAGETGSEALKERVANEEQQVANLTEQLAIAESHKTSFEEEIALWKGKLETMSAEENKLRSKLQARGTRAKDMSKRLFAHNDRMVRMLEQLGFSISRQDDHLVFQRASKVNASTILGGSNSRADMSMAMNRTLSGYGTSPAEHYSSAADLETLYWTTDSDETSEDIKYQSFITSLTRLDADAAVDVMIKRYKDVETLAKKYQKDSRAYREKSHRLQTEAHDKIAYRSFKEGDLALFLPTRNQATRPWAAFNVGAPHYFLREQDAHKLQARDWLLARISRVEERVVDLSRSLTNGLRSQPDRRSINTEMSDGASARSVDDENPFELSDGLRWFMIDAFEEKPGAPSTPGLGKSTVAATNVDVKGSIRLTKEGKKTRLSSSSGNAVMATKTLTKSLDSRRSSSGSKKGHTPSQSTNAVPVLPVTDEGSLRPAVVAETSNGTGDEAREDAQVFEEVRRDLLWGP